MKRLLFSIGKKFGQRTIQNSMNSSISINVQHNKSNANTFQTQTRYFSSSKSIASSKMNSNQLETTNKILPTKENINQSSFYSFKESDFENNENVLSAKTNSISLNNQLLQVIQQSNNDSTAKITKTQFLFQAFVALISVFFSGFVFVEAASHKRTAGELDQEREFAEQSNTTVKQMYRQIMKDETGLVNPKKQSEKAPIYRIVLTGGPCGGKST
jgi:hypothetical protein